MKIVGLVTINYVKVPTFRFDVKGLIEIFSNISNCDHQFTRILKTIFSTIINNGEINCKGITSKVLHQR